MGEIVKGAVAVGLTVAAVLFAEAARKNAEANLENARQGRTSNCGGDVSGYPLPVPAAMPLFR